jgi:hypothetical protein
MRYTYCSVLVDGMPQMIIVEVEDDDVPAGVPTFATKAECRKFMRRTNDEDELE